MIKKAIFPGCYLQGYGILKDLSLIEELKGKKLFILTTKSAINKIISKNIEKWQKYCEIEYKQFSGKCTWDEINRVIALIKEQKADFVAGMGGGKCLDTARVAAKKMDKKFISIPTIAATDAPTASACVVHNKEGAMIDYFNTKNPDYVLVDTKVISEAPARFLISGMGDALSTWFEAETCHISKVKNVAGEYNTRAIMAIAKLCYETLLEYGVAAKLACESDLVTPALEHVVEANILLSGLGFESGGISTAHGIHNVFLHTDAAKNHYHGEIVTFGVLASLFLEDKEMSLVDEVYTFCEDVGLPTTLADIGVANITDKELLTAIENELNDSGALIQRMSIKPTPQAILDSIKMADTVGKKKKVIDPS
jgi:glycerol dehydrogenase